MKHGHGNDGPAMPASVAHRGAGPVRSQSRVAKSAAVTSAIIMTSVSASTSPSPADAPDPQDGLVAVDRRQRDCGRGGLCRHRFRRELREDKGCYSIAMGEAIFQASAQSASRAAPRAAASTFLDVSGADFIFERESRAGEARAPRCVGAARNSTTSAIDIHGWSPPHGPIVIELGSRPSVTISRSATTRSMASSRRSSQWPRRMAPTPCRPRSPSALTVENQFSFVHGMAMVAL